LHDLKAQKKQLLETEGHILALGGPGSGKTFIALLKADLLIKKRELKKGQRIIFLSFARATIARVAQQAGKYIGEQERKDLEINTYHGFAWNLIRSHAYLLNIRPPIRLLPPPEAASRLAGTDPAKRNSEMVRLFKEESLIHFDLFASISAELLHRSQSLARIVCDAYPVIILDEFQDTNLDEWQMIQSLGRHSHLIALADAEQRIYEFRGADPKRISQFIKCYSPTQFDFGLENNRSNGTDIVVFGNDLLSGANKGKKYNDVEIVQYGFYAGYSSYYPLKTALIQGIKRRIKDANPWSIAVLVPTKRLMLSISDYLSSTKDKLPTIYHDVALDSEGPSLAAILIAGLIEGGTSHDLARRLINDLCIYIRGRRGSDGPNKADMAICTALDCYLHSNNIRGKKRKEIIEESHRIASSRCDLKLSGDPSEDWLTIRRLLEESSAESIIQVADDSKSLRLLHKGALLRSKLGDLWRKNREYAGASDALREALLAEHFSAALKDWRGVHVMTIHKSKGKEFDEVFIYEGLHQGRFVHINGTEREIAQERLALRVAVTRSMKRCTILTPTNDPCSFL
jgi:DNA helicase II / ATP-dependent DNA helicase PcrA